MQKYKYRVSETSLFKRTRKLAVKRGLDIRLLDETVRKLARGEKLPPSYKDHQLKGELSHLRECHLQGDWLLTYQIIEDKLILSLHSTGTHADMFE